MDNLDVACEVLSSDIPSYAKNNTVWCSKWYPADKVLGFSDGSTPGFRGSFNDGRAHFEGARSRLEQMNFPLAATRNTESEPFVFVSWGLGTGELSCINFICCFTCFSSHHRTFSCWKGHTIFWTRDRTKAGEPVTFHPATNQTASTSPQIYTGEELAPILSTEPVYQIHEILVNIPEIVRSKNITLALDGYEQPLNKPLPLWMILDGSVWSNPSISRTDVRLIYGTFFRTQVVTAIKRGDLPKPSAMVFSGGQEEHFHIAGMLSDMLEKQGIKSVPGFKGGSHCGVVRLSYPDSRVECQFEGQKYSEARPQLPRIKSDYPPSISTPLSSADFNTRHSLLEGTRLCRLRDPPLVEKKPQTIFPKLDAMRINPLYQCAGSNYDVYTLQHMIPFIQRKQRDNPNYGTRPTIVPYSKGSKPRSINVLALGNSHTRQIFIAMACQYQDAIIQSGDREINEEVEIVFSLGPNSNITFTLLYNHPAFHSKRWQANLDEILHRPLKDFDALLVGKFNDFKPEWEGARVWTYMRLYAERVPSHKVDLDQVPGGIPLGHLLEAYQGPIIYMSMMAVYGNVDFQQGLKLIELANRTDSVHAVNTRDHVDEPEFMQRECAYPETGSEHLVEDCVNTTNGHRCFGDKGGESDIAAYEVVEELWEALSMDSDSAYASK